MNIFKIHWGYREIGVSYGLPSLFIDFGFGSRYDPINLIKKLRDEGLDKETLVVLRNDALKEKGIKTLVEGLRAVKARIEIEDSGENKDPLWFPLVDRWIVDWVSNPEFNYGCLRPRQDVLIYRGDSIEEFISSTQELQAIKAAISDDKEKLFEVARKSGIRIYEKESER